MNNNKEILNLVNVLADSVLNDKVTTAKEWTEHCEKAKMCIRAAREVIK